MVSFNARLEATCRSLGSRVCVGLDPDPDRMPTALGRGPKDVEAFLRRVIDATAPHAAAYKPNSAFFEAMGAEGHHVLANVIAHVHDETDALVILDVKRGDIGNTASMYARAAFDVLGADAVTVSPYMGRDSIEPFAVDAAKGVFVLVRTSNPGARDLQDLVLAAGGSLFESMAGRVRDWNERGNLGLVAGATYPEDMARVREIVGDGVPFLVPGVGAQGGDVEAVVAAALAGSGGGFVINAGRSILYASKGEDFEAAAGAAAAALNEEILAARPTSPT